MVFLWTNSDITASWIVTLYTLGLMSLEFYSKSLCYLYIICCVSEVGKVKIGIADSITYSTGKVL